MYHPALRLTPYIPVAPLSEKSFGLAGAWRGLLGLLAKSLTFVFPQYVWTKLSWDLQREGM